MSQERLNNLAVGHVQKDVLDKVNVHKLSEKFF